MLKFLKNFFIFNKINSLNKGQKMKLSDESKEKLIGRFLGNPQSIINSNTKSPTIYVLAGGPGSGKTTFRREAFKLGTFNTNMHLHEPDEVMRVIPEYQNAINQEGLTSEEYINVLQKARADWNEPALALANEMLKTALGKRMDIIYECTCAMSESYNFLKEAKALGYKIIFRAFYTDIQTALVRTNERAKAEGRTLPDNITINRSKKFAKLFVQYKELADETYLFKSEENKFTEVRDYSEFLALSKNKIAIIGGSGSTGSYFALKLLSDNNKISIFSRLSSELADKVKKDGYKIKLAQRFNDNQEIEYAEHILQYSRFAHVGPFDENESYKTQDVVLVTLKQRDMTKEIAQQIIRLTDENSYVIFVSNGLPFYFLRGLDLKKTHIEAVDDKGEINAILSNRKIIALLPSISAEILGTAEAKIDTLPEKLRIEIGSLDKNVNIDLLTDIFKEADLKYSVAENIHHSILKKLIFCIVVNDMSALLEKTNDDAFDHLKKNHKDFIQYVIKFVNQLGLDLKLGEIISYKDFIDNTTPSKIHFSSMHSDIKKGKLPEIKSFLEAPIELYNYFAVSSQHDNCKASGVSSLNTLATLLEKKHQKQEITQDDLKSLFAEFTQQYISNAPTSSEKNNSVDLVVETFNTNGVPLQINEDRSSSESIKFLNNFYIGYLIEKNFIYPVMSFVYDQYHQKNQQKHFGDYFAGIFSLDNMKQNVLGLIFYKSLSAFTDFSIANKIIASGFFTRMLMDDKETFTPDLYSNLLKKIAISFCEFSIANLLSNNKLLEDHHFLKGLVTGLSGDISNTVIDMVASYDFSNYLNLLGSNNDNLDQ